MPATFPTESAYRSHLATRLREHLFNLLGPYCAECGCDLRSKAWEVNHIYGRDWSPRRLSFYRRNLRYWREAQEGLVNLLCRPCNLAYLPKPLPSVVINSNDPF